MPELAAAAFTGTVRSLFPGILASVIVAIAAVFLNEHYGAPAMLFALLLGLSLKFLSEDGPCLPGILTSSTTILRIGVALLGFRITTDQLVALGPSALAVVFTAVVCIIGFALLLSRLLGLDWKLGLLTGCSVGICGAAAAMTISALLPKSEETSRWTLFTVVGVTSLSTLAMIIYPILASFIGLDSHDTGFFLGATIHDVAQVMGAGYAVSDSTGDTAALTKMIRVSMLVPVAFVISLAVSDKVGRTGSIGKALPWFLVLFVAFATASSLNLVPQAMLIVVSDASRWCLIVGIAAMGMRTSFKDVLAIGPRAILLLCAETLALAFIILCAIFLRGR